MPEPDVSTLRRIYVDMVRSRAFEEVAISLAAEGRVPGSWMSGIGQEGTLGAVGQLRSDDFLTYTHRGAYCFLSRGSDPGRLLAELLGKRTGYCRGKGGRHIADLEHGIFGKSGTIGGHAPIAVGMATAIRIRGDDRVVLSLFGEGASNRGTTHAAMNVAAVAKLPIVWICENNGWAGSTPATAILALPDVAALGAGYGIPCAVVEGNDVMQVFRAAAPAIARARTGEGPSLLELKTYRLRSFSESWGRDRRDAAEVEEWRRRDPIRAFRSRLRERGILADAEAEEIGDAARREMDAARVFAEESPFPDPREAFEDLHA